MKKISIIIVTKNRKRDIIECIESVCNQTLLPDEVVVIDGSDTRELESELKNHFKEKIKTPYTYSDKSGLCHDRNIGVEKSHGDYLIFLDDDVILDKDYIREVVHVFNSYPEEVVGGVTGEVIEESPKKITKKLLSFCYYIYATIFLLHRYGNGRFQLSGASTMIKSGSVNKIIEVDYLYGCNMAFRRKAFDDFRFDENLRSTHTGWIGEDDDIAHHLLKKHKNFYTPFAKLVHNFSIPERKLNDYGKLEAAIMGTYDLFKKDLPQDFKHKLAFWWAVTGFLMKESITGIKHRHLGGTKGIISGCIKIFKGQPMNTKR